MSAAGEQKGWDKQKKRSEEKDKKNPDAGVKNGERAKKVTGRTPGETKRIDPSVAQDNRGPRMSPGTLGNSIKQGARNAGEGMRRILPQPQQGRTASA